MNQVEIEAVNQAETKAETTPTEEPVKEKIEMKSDANLESGSGDAKKNEPEAEEAEKAINGDCKVNEEQSETAVNGSDELNKTNDENGVEDITDAMMENIKENFNQDIDSMVNLMESAEDFMFDKSEDKQKNMKAATEANQHRQQQQESQSAINSDKSEAYSLLAQGKRNLFIKDYESAVSLLGEACEKLCSIYGDFALELGDAYMTYGSALLELWRIEEGEKPKNEEAKSADDNEENENEEEDEPNEVEETEDNDAEDDTKNNEGGDDEENDEGEEQNNEEDGEDIQNDDDNLQIAWEVTELARNIYLKHNDNLNLAKVHLKLGEISIACGNYDGAIEELNKSLEIQEKLTPVDKRLKANTHFNLSVVYASYPDYDKCDEELNIAKSVFESQLDDLNDKLKTLDKSKTSEINKVKSEISDAEEILQDLKSKILENSKSKRELMASAYEVIKKKLSEQSTPSNTISVSNGLPGNSSSAPVNNISHLVRREPKQKQEPSTESHHSPLKQTLIAKNSSSQNGVTSSNDESKPTNGSQECEIADGKTDECETNEKKRKLSASEEDTSAKKACLRPEDS